LFICKILALKRVGLLLGLNKASYTLEEGPLVALVLNCYIRIMDKAPSL
jgi:hypothetical protein